MQAEHGAERAGKIVEAALGSIAKRLTAQGVGSLIVAGGETSGAVVSALNVSVLRIGPEIAPGVPWTETDKGSGIALALKSGNFGSEAFFDEAFALLS